MEMGKMPQQFNSRDVEFDETGLNNEIWDLLSVYADGEATAAEITHVEELLRSDAVYAQRLSFIKTASVAVRTVTEVEPPTSLRSAIFDATVRKPSMVARFRQMVQGISTPRWALSTIGLAAAGVLLIGVTHDAHIKTPTFVRAATTNGVVTSVAIAPPRGAEGATRGHEHLNAIIASRTSSDLSTVGLKNNQTKARPVSQNIVSATLVEKFDTKLPTRLNSRSIIASPGTKMFHADEPVTLTDAAYRPGMDAQNQRPTVARRMPDPASAEIQGEDIHTADVASTTGKSVPSADSSVVAPQVAQPTTPVAHVIIAKLTALPPDPGQVLTRADMARTHDAITSGYDRSTLKSLERKEASISLLRGTF